MATNTDCGTKHLALVLAILTLVAAMLTGFWCNQQNILVGLDTRLRTVEQRQSAVVANQDQMIKQLDRIEKMIADHYGRPVVSKP